MDPDIVARLKEEGREMLRLDAESRELAREAAGLLGAGRAAEASAAMDRAVAQMQAAADIMNLRRAFITAVIAARTAGLPDPPYRPAGDTPAAHPPAPGRDGG